MGAVSGGVGVSVCAAGSHPAGLRLRPGDATARAAAKAPASFPSFTFWLLQLNFTYPSSGTIQTS
jgi:hypothetical protein